MNKEILKSFFNREQLIKDIVMSIIKEKGGNFKELFEEVKKQLPFDKNNQTANFIQLAKATLILKSQVKKITTTKTKFLRKNSEQKTLK